MTDDQVVAPASRTVLLVDDQAQLRKVLARLVARLGHQVREAGSGKEALEDLAHVMPPADILITDVLMPGMLGTDLVLRARELRPSIPVILVTGYAGQSDLEEVQALPDVTLLVKPFALETLREAIDMAFSPAA